MDVSKFFTVSFQFSQKKAIWMGRLRRPQKTVRKFRTALQRGYAPGCWHKIYGIISSNGIIKPCNDIPPCFMIPTAI